MSGTITARDTVAAPPVTRHSTRRLAIAAASLLVALGAAWYGADWWQVGRFIESTDDAYVGGNVTAVAPHVAGFVAQILVADNQRVRAGQLLIRLDDRDYRAALDHADAVVGARQAALAGLAARAVLQRSTITQAEAALAAARAKAAFAQQDAQRYRTLARTPAGSQQDAQRTAALDQEARSAALSARAGRDAAREQLAVIQTGIIQARASLAQAQADLRTAQLDLGYTEIRAPIDGYVGARSAQVGAYVAAGTMLLSVVPANGLWVDANFKEDELAHMKPGQPATVIADAQPGQKLHGHLLSLAPATGAVFSVIPPENATGNFTKIVQRVPVRIALDDADGALGALRPGLSTTVRVDTRR